MADAKGQPTGRWSDPRWNYPEYPPGSVIEIRVHGVGGEPPSAMTRDPDPVLVGGDELAGFHRARNPVVGEVDTSEAAGPGPGAAESRTNGDPGRRRRPALHVREVLAWGGQTSGTVRHALWVLLLPFALFNVAGRMHRTSSRTCGRLQRAVCRVLALTLTLSVVALTAGIVFDLVAVQCGGHGAACLGGSTSGRAPLAPFRAFDEDVIGRFGIAALVPLLVVVAFWYSGRYGSQQLETRGDGRTSASERADHEPTSLADGDFWRNAWPASRLRGLHATAGFAWSAGTLALSAHLVLLDLAGPGEPITAAWLVLAVGAAVTVLACLVLVALPAIAVPGPSTRLHVAETALRGVGLGGLGLGVGAALLGRLLMPTEDAARASLGVPVLSIACIVAGVGALLVWALGTRGWPLRRNWGPRSAFVTEGLDGQPNVSISGANAGLLVGSVLLGAAITSSRPGAVVRDAYLDPPTAELGGLPSLLHGPDGLLPGLFPGPYLPLLGLVAVQAGLVLVLALLSAWRPSAEVLRPGRDERLDDGSAIGWHLTPVVVALVATLLVTAVGAGLHRLLVDALGSHVVAADLATAEVALPLVTPWWYGLTALVVVALPLVGLGVYVDLALRRRAAQPPREVVARHLGDAYARAGLDAPGPDDDRLDDVAAAWMTQRLLRDAGPLLAWTVGLVTGGVLLAFVWLWFRDGRFATALPLVSLATWVVVAIPPAAVALIRSALSDRGRRREVGRIWDVLTFWPRVTHPFAPPCYAEALVPMLEDRVRRLVGAQTDASVGDAVQDDGTTATRGVTGDGPVDLGYRVILAGHSQGSVVSLAVAARLEAEQARAAVADEPEPSEAPAPVRRVALVSYGSPIAILYERYFRATLAATVGRDETVYDRVEGAVHSWHHLFSLTEPFAFPFWAGDPEAGSATRSPSGKADAGWTTTVGFAGADEEPCPACEGDTAGQRTCCVEVVVRDPDRWTLWDSTPVPVLGHSVYHRHPDVDAHLARIARSLVAARDAAAPLEQEERRTDRWWRTGV